MPFLSKVLDKFWNRVNKNGSIHPVCGRCWEWIGGTTSKGYGAIKTPKQEYAHRVSWRIHNGMIPNNLCVLHRCDNPLCVNPGHLFLGTLADNNHDKAVKGRASQGENHWKSKLTEANVLEIRRLFKIGWSQVKLAKLFKISYSQIRNIVHRRSWVFNSYKNST